MACLPALTLRGLLQVDQKVVDSQVHELIHLKRRVKGLDALLADIEVFGWLELRRKGNAGVIRSRFA